MTQAYRCALITICITAFIMVVGAMLLIFRESEHTLSYAVAALSTAVGLRSVCDFNSKGK